MLKWFEPIGSPFSCWDLADCCTTQSYLYCERMAQNLCKHLSSVVNTLHCEGWVKASICSQAGKALLSRLEKNVIRKAFIWAIGQREVSWPRSLSRPSAQQSPYPSGGGEQRRGWRAKHSQYRFPSRRFATSCLRRRKGSKHQAVDHPTNQSEQLWKQYRFSLKQ